MSSYRKRSIVVKAMKLRILGEFYPCKPDVFEATYEAV